MNPKKTTRFAGLTEAAQFYGIARGQFFELKKLGASHGDALPYDDPPAMPVWFERMIARGARRRGCPDSVMQRATEATTAAAPAKTSKRKPATVTKTAPAAVTAPAPPAAPPVRLTLSEDGSDLESISTGQRRMHAALAARYEQYVVDGEQEGPQALALYKRMVDLETRILSWQKNARAMRGDGEWMRTAEVAAVAREVAGQFHSLLRRELVAQFPASDHERVMAALDMVSDRLPNVMPAALKAAA